MELVHTCTLGKMKRACTAHKLEEVTNTKGHENNQHACIHGWMTCRDDGYCFMRS